MTSTPLIADPVASPAEPAPSAQQIRDAVAGVCDWFNALSDTDLAACAMLTQGMDFVVDFYTITSDRISLVDALPRDVKDLTVSGVQNVYANGWEGLPALVEGISSNDVLELRMIALDAMRLAAVAHIPAVAHRVGTVAQPFEAIRNFYAVYAASPQTVQSEVRKLLPGRDPRTAPGLVAAVAASHTT